MTRLAAWARARASVIYLTALVVALNGTGLFWIRHQVAATQAAAQRQGELVEHKLCASFGHLAELHPPAGNPATNPSRGFDQQLHVRLDELGTDIGCHGGTP